jgi:hypothetical protein
MPPPLNLNGEDSDAIIKYAKRVLVESEIDMKKAYSEGQEVSPFRGLFLLKKHSQLMCFCAGCTNLRHAVCWVRPR